MMHYACALIVDCELPATCFVDDFVTHDDYHPRQLLGEWHLVARLISDDHAVFHSLHMVNKYDGEHEGHHRGHYTVVGQKIR